MKREERERTTGTGRERSGGEEGAAAEEGCRRAVPGRERRAVCERDGSKCLSVCPHACVQTCPVGAFSLIGGVAIAFDQRACVGCGACVSRCPGGALSMRGGAQGDGGHLAPAGAEPDGVARGANGANAGDGVASGAAPRKRLGDFRARRRANR